MLTARCLPGIPLLGAIVTVALAAATGFGYQPREPYRIGNGVSAPTLIEKFDPEYTKQALDEKIEGIVVLHVIVAASGITEDIYVIRSLDSGLDRKAIEAVKRWRFKPGTRQGKPVDVKATIEVRFRLPKDPPDGVLVRLGRPHS